MSHPAWGAWIEIRKGFTTRVNTCGRTPHGVRGLKSSIRCPKMPLTLSHPAWGAWIEIKKIIFLFYKNIGRTPHGVRGLK